MGFYDRLFGKKKAASVSSAKDYSKKAEDASVCINKGNALVESSMYAEAIQCYEKALEINPKLTEAWNNKGLALAKSGKIDEAIICYDKALQIDPKDHVPLNNKGSALYKKGNIEEAMKSYELAFELNPESKTAKGGMEMCMKSLNKSG